MYLNALLVERNSHSEERRIAKILSTEKLADRLLTKILSITQIFGRHIWSNLPTPWLTMYDCVVGNNLLTLTAFPLLSSVSDSLAFQFKKRKSMHSRR